MLPPAPSTNPVHNPRRRTTPSYRTMLMPDTWRPALLPLAPADEETLPCDRLDPRPLLDTLVPALFQATRRPRAISDAQLAEVIRLRAREDLTSAVVAHRLGLSISQVRNAWHQALVALVGLCQQDAYARMLAPWQELLSPSAAPDPAAYRAPDSVLASDLVFAINLAHLTLPRAQRFLMRVRSAPPFVVIAPRDYLPLWSAFEQTVRTESRLWSLENAAAELGTTPDGAAALTYLEGPLYLTRDERIGSRFWNGVEQYIVVAEELAASTVGVRTFHFSEMAQAVSVAFPHRPPMSSQEAARMAREATQANRLSGYGPQGYYVLRAYGDRYWDNREAIRAVLRRAPLDRSARRTGYRHHSQIDEALVRGGRYIPYHSLLSILSHDDAFVSNGHGCWALRCDVPASAQEIATLLDEVPDAEQRAALHEQVRRDGVTYAALYEAVCAYRRATTSPQA